MTDTRLVGNTKANLSDIFRLFDASVLSFLSCEGGVENTRLCSLDVFRESETAWVRRSVHSDGLLLH